MSIHLETALLNLKKRLLDLATLTEDQVEQAVVALNTRNSTLAQEVIERDTEVDHTEVDVEEECLKMLALYQPVAHDLRFIISVLKINDILERIGDYAVNIAERALFLSKRSYTKMPVDFSLMMDKSRSMLRDSLDAMLKRNATLARQVVETDTEVDRIHRENFSKVQNQILSHPAEVESLIQLLSVSRYLERISDLSTNIAQDVIYMVEGKIVRHHRSPQTFPN